MKQIILDDFSGGQNEVVMPREFSNGQWHQLIGLIANEDGRVETQPAIQRVGSFPSGDHFYKLHSINTSIGTYLLAITRLGRLYWCKAPDANAVYTTANATTWYQITTAENYNWSTTAAGTVKETLVDNPYLHFLCDIPVRAYLYARTPNTSGSGSLTANETARALEYDTDTANNLNTGQFPGVLINYRRGNAAPSSPQVIVAYVNTRETNPALQVKALVFPNMRRVPTYEVALESAAKDSPRATKNFINGLYLYGKTYEDGVQAEDVVNRWPFGLPSDAPSVRMHPYGYTNVDGANLSGTGIIPRASVGCAIENKLLLGDIEWRMSADDLPKVPVAPVTIGTVTTVASTISWPTEKGLLNKGRVVYNNGPGTVYLSKDAGVAGSYRQVSVGVSRVSKTGSTCTIVLKKIPNLTAVPLWDAIKVTGVGPNFNGVFGVPDSVSLVGSTITFTFNRTGSPTNIANGKRSGKVTFFKAGEGFDIEIPAGDYAALPNDDGWDDFYALSDDTSTIAGLPDRNVARHFLNDNNTGPVRNGIYFSIADIDQFNPTAQIEISRGGATIAGMHTIDSTIVAVTEGGGETDGVYRIRGSLTLAAANDPTALRTELVKGGIGVWPYEDYTNRDRRSCLWPDAGIVVFVDRLGGVWTTDGNKCDRIDRIGPVTPTITSAGMLANVAAVGKYLFMRRNGAPGPFGGYSLYCFSIVRSDGSNAQGVWTQISLSTDPKVALNASVPADAVVHMQKGDGYTLYSDKALYPQQLTGGQDDLFFIGVLNAGGQSHPNTINANNALYDNAAGGHVYRLALRGPAAERGKIDNVPVIQIVQTPTLGSETEFDTTNWHTVSAAFVSRGDTYLWGWFASPFSVYPASVGHLGQGGVGNTFSNTSTPSPNHYYSSAVKAIRQYKQSAHVGQSRMFSYRLYFEGDVVLQSFSVWSSGEVPVDGRST